MKQNRFKRYLKKELPNFISIKDEAQLSNIQTKTVYSMLIQETNRAQMVEQFCRLASWLNPNYTKDVE